MFLPVPVHNTLFCNPSLNMVDLRHKNFANRQHTAKQLKARRTGTQT